MKTKQRGNAKNLAQHMAAPKDTNYHLRQCKNISFLRSKAAEKIAVIGDRKMDLHE